LTEEEHAFRLSQFAKTNDLIDDWNSNSSNTHEIGHNMFSDMTEDEIIMFVGQDVE